MTDKEIILEIENMRKFNYTLAPDEVFNRSIQAIQQTGCQKQGRVLLDYTDISSKIEDAKNALNSLYELVYCQYDNIFQGKDAEKYQRILQDIKSADRCMNEVNELNNRLSDVFEENLDRL